MKSRYIIDACLKFIHHYFLWLLIGSYALATVCPALGLWLREVSVGAIAFRQQKIVISLPMLMLGLLLFNAGLGVKTNQLRDLFRKPLALLSGLSSNMLVPLGFIWCMARLLKNWCDFDDMQIIIIGLTLVAAMPIAGSSTAWSQNTNGDMALSLALMLFSTFLSPLTTPMTFNLAERLTHEEYADAMIDLGAQGSGFLFWVVVPSVLGIVSRPIIGERRIEALKPGLKLLNYTNLLLLNYANAALSLPQTLVDPDWNFLALTLLIVTGLCMVTFASGWGIGQAFNLGRAQQVSLMYGLGMSNNGTGLVLASMVLVDYPKAMVPLIFYNLVQHLVAGAVAYWLSRSSTEGRRLPAAV